jgi:hypothetical protein
MVMEKDAELVAEPTDTVSVTVTGPLLFGIPVARRVRLAPAPPRTRLVTGISAVSGEAAVTTSSAHWRR